jgi:hypothetical protein
MTRYQPAALVKRPKENAMPVAHARIETGRASRYLTQFCQHVQRISDSRGPVGHARRTPARHAPPGRPAQGRPAEPPRVAWSDTQGTVTIGDATITLQAGPSALLLRAEAGSDDSLQQAQELAAGLLARIGRRDNLSVTWLRAGTAA